MPVDNRHFIIEDLPEDPEDALCPEEDEDEEDDELMSNSAPIQPQTTPYFGQPVVPPTPRAPWQQPSTVWPPSGGTTPTYRPPTTPWTTPSFGGAPIGQQQVQTRPQAQSYAQSNQNRIDRRKKIIFCDLIDILIESESAVREQAQGNYFTGINNYKRTGVMPRGLYDVRLKLEVWSKIAAFSPDYVFCVTNQPEMSEEGLKAWSYMTDFVMGSLADYLRLPKENCKCLTKIGFDRRDPDVKPGIGLLKKALVSIPSGGYRRRDMVVIGANSGYSNQSNIDKIMAEKVKIDYIDVNDLLTIFY